jgi:predicted branched-subunit amino acid permease
MSWGLELAGTLTLVALLVPLCRHWPVLAGAVVAAVTSVMAHNLPLRLGLPLGIVFGVVTAFFVERRRGAA